MINNLERIKTLLKFDSEDDFYHLQIIKRKKEHPELGSNSYVVKTYYIRSVEYLEKKMPEIIALCDFHNARGCINLNRRSFEKMAFHLLRKVADQIMNKDFKSARKAFESVCGAYANEPEKKWIIDIDGHWDKMIRAEKIEKEIDALEPVGPKRIATLHTKNGIHLIVKPFNKSKVSFTDDIHKDNPTILYIP